MKLTHHCMGSDGRWATSEQARPACLEQWRACWETFSVAAFMLEIVNAATLKRYAQKFEERCARYPRAWHICVKAEDRCRNEFMAEEMRRQARFHQEHPTISGYDAKAPWNQVFRESALNVEFWLENLQEPAMRYDDTRADVAPSWTHQQEAPETGKGKGQKRQWPEHDQVKRKGLQDKKGGLLQNDAQGREICLKYSRNLCSDPACGRAHVCNYCGTPHRACEKQCNKSQRFFDVNAKKGGKKGKLSKK